MANNRNKICSCGSGKKYKKCCINNKKRDHYIYIGSNEPVSAIHYNVNGEIKIIQKNGHEVAPDQVLSQTSYERDNGKPKIITSISNLAITNIPEYLTTFDLVFAIDTNTKEINKEMISVTGLVEAKLTKEIEQHRIKIDISEKGLFLFTNCTNLHPEKHSWWHFIEILQKEENYSPNLKIAIITDHDLGNHSEYNKGTIPIYKDQILPNNFSLIFATSDTKNDGILNNLISHCDVMASKVINSLEKEGKFTTEGQLNEFNNLIDFSND